MIDLKQVLLIFFLFYSLLLVYLYLQQKNFIFFPNKARHEVSDKDTEVFNIARDDERLNGWLINPDFAGKKMILYYGGNAEDIFYSIDQFRDYSDTAALLVNYRGYGSSSGSPSQQHLFDDALAIYDDIYTKYQPDKLFLMGRSLGSGVAAYVASCRRVDGVILVTPYDSIESLAKRQFPFLPISFLLHHKFLSVEYAKKIEAPCLIIYGGRDATVPPSSTEVLLNHISSEKTVVFIPEAEHNNIELFDEYNLAVLKFIH